MKPLTHEEKLVFGADAKRHPVTGIPLETGIGAAPENAQARNHLLTIAEIQGASAAEGYARGARAVRADRRAAIGAGGNQPHTEKETMMVTLRQEELQHLRDTGGEQAVRDHFANEERNVFGHDFKRGKDGAPIEQGLGSPAQPTQQSVDGYERWCKDQPGYAATLAKMKADLAAFQAKKRGSG
jgi:hypothetical protein